VAADAQPRPFILMARELTLLGFYTSRPGITENMDYQAVPTAFHGCVPVSQMKKPVYWE
jgi:gluconate 2-dehydrogenase gamma chain